MQSVFEQVSPCPSLERAQGVGITSVGRKNNDAGVREFAANCPYGVYSAHFWHLQIHQRHIGSVRPKLQNGFAAVRRLGHQLEVRLSGYEGSDPLTNQGVIV